MGNLSNISKIFILSLSTMMIYYVYSPDGFNLIKITKYIKTMPKKSEE
jgi:hypothetical protein